MFTPHALQRMEERKIPAQKIEYCLRHGVVCSNKIDVAWKVKIIEENIGLCLVVDRVRRVIVTMYWL